MTLNAFKSFKLKFFNDLCQLRIIDGTITIM